MKSVGDVVLQNTGSYQDFVAVLLSNGYAVTIVPICNKKNLAIEIMEVDESEEL